MGVGIASLCTMYLVKCVECRMTPCTIGSVAHHMQCRACWKTFSGSWKSLWIFFLSKRVGTLTLIYCIFYSADLTLDDLMYEFDLGYAFCTCTRVPSRQKWSFWVRTFKNQHKRDRHTHTNKQIRPNALPQLHSLVAKWNVAWFLYD